MNRIRSIGAVVAGALCTALIAACGQASSASATRTPAPSSRPAGTQTLPPALNKGGLGGAPLPADTPEPTAAGNAGVVQKDLMALASLVYPPDGKSTCEQGTEPALTNVARCPFTSALAIRVFTAEQAQQKAGGSGVSVVCHCQSQPSAYTATKALGTIQSGIVTVIAEYGAGNNLTFTVTIVTDHGRPLVGDITVSGPKCARPEEIDATQC